MTNSVIARDPNILGGTPVFSGTRVPIRVLFEHLEAGDRIDDFLAALITADKNIQHQQNLEALPCPVVVLSAHRTRLQDLLPLVPKSSGAF